MSGLRIAALADLHLGFQQFTTVKRGVNARQMDVLKTWKGVVDDICVANPDVITIAGDVFHRSRVSNHAMRAFLAGISQLLMDTEADIHIVTGNHEASRSAEVMNPNKLARTLRGFGRVHVYDTFAVYFDPEERYQLTAMPFETGGARVVTFPERRDGADGPIPSILVIHAAIQAPGVPKFYADEGCPHIDDLAPHFDVVCAGDLHNSMALKNDHDCIAFYSGSIDYTSSNIWAEDVDKGWVLVELEGDEESPNHPGTTRRMLSPAVRRVCDLEDKKSVTAEQLNDHLRVIAESGLVSPDRRRPIVRLKVPHFDKTERLAVDQTLVKALKRACLHFELDLCYKGVTKAADGEGEAMATFRPRSLRELADEFFEDDEPEIRERAYALIDERWAR